MEALAILSLTGNVVQFVQFTYGLIHSTRRIYASASGASDRAEHLDYIHNQLKTQYTNISEDGRFEEVDPLSPLVDMARRSKEVGQQLLDMIDELKLKNVKPGKWWRSLGKALREARELDEVKELKIRIDDLQGAMVLYLCTTSRETIEKLARDTTLLKKENLIIHKERSEQLVKLSDDVQAVRLSIQELKLQALNGTTITEESNITLMTSTIQNLSLAARDLQKENAVLRSLNYSARTTRRETIPKAHEETFQWIFDRQSANETRTGFVEWLKHGNKPFWITGRPGSGKSTLMRFISGHSNTLGFLEKVAAPCKTFIVDHYFWSAGTVMQRSQEGLYRSILMQILANIPEMAHELPGVEEKSPSELETGRWDLDQLHAALDALATSDKISTIFGIFIDGIDEYDGDHVDICQALLRLSKSRKIKLCISSRPWNVFQDHFGQDKAAMLAVHDLTLKDIRVYATARLKEHYRWKALTARSHEAEVLISEISKKAHGVFLWVFLVTKLLREGLTNDDSIIDLRKRLRMIPADLESFFQHILDSVEPFYHDKMAGTLVMALTAAKPLDAELYAFGEGEFDDAEYATKQCVKVIDPHERESQIQTFSRRLNGRCKGLLEVGQDKNVNFLHRTVRDFLRTKQMDSFLRNKNRTRLEPHLSIFKAYLSCMKQTMFTDNVDKKAPGIFRGDFMSKLQAAFLYLGDEDTQMDQIESLLDETESATIAIFAAGQARLLPTLEPWSPIWSPRLLFREFILIHGPVHCLSRKLASSPKYFIDLDSPPLMFLLRYNVDSPSYGCEGPSPSKKVAAVKILLESGADPNQVFFDRDIKTMATPWTGYISRIVDSVIKRKPTNVDGSLEALIPLLMAFGASPNAMTQAPHAVTLGHKSVLIPAWLNLFFAVFTLEHGQQSVEHMYLEALTRTMEKGADFRSMTLPTPHLGSSAFSTITPWKKLIDLIREDILQQPSLQSQALVKLIQLSDPDILPWDDLMPVIRERHSKKSVRMIEEALAKRTSMQHSLSQPGMNKRGRNPEEPDMETREMKRSKRG
ncbi:hypothetical protein PG985_007469 [Apiospora marii]|uniref:NACHT domain-containing protein n=1 Tax=Apiospora marii TaxID=335849 RepID=A0ABR1SNH1_9PEZI